MAQLPGGQPLSGQPIQTKPSRRSDDEVDALMGMLAEPVNSHTTAYPDRTYEDGVDSALAWVFGFSNDNPMTGGR